jgi:hypothetical protein
LEILLRAIRQEPALGLGNALKRAGLTKRQLGEVRDGQFVGRLTALVRDLAALLRAAAKESGEQ